MDPKHLTQLAVVFENGSISAAARALTLTQPTLTRNMATLEMQAGATLFTRSRFGVRSTPLGDTLAREGRGIARRMQEAGAAIARHKMGLVQHLRVGTGPWLGMALLPELSLAFMQALPGVALTVTVDRPGLLLHALVEGQMDLVFAPAGTAKLPAGLHREVLAADSLGVFCGVDHPLARRPDVDAQQLADADWIAAGPSSPFQHEEMEFLRANGVTRQHMPFATVGDALVLLEVLKKGRHLAVLPRRLVSLLRRQHALHEIALPKGSAPRAIEVWLQESGARPAAAQALISQARSLLHANEIASTPVV
ncbi:MAG: hypothetical protein RLZ83_559 [Pseudomonadota bacterium]|jgi:DNA-binding transcriptional LysR family regulator